MLSAGGAKCLMGVAGKGVVFTFRPAAGAMGGSGASNERLCAGATASVTGAGSGAGVGAGVSAGVASDAVACAVTLLLVDDEPVKLFTSASVESRCWRMLCGSLMAATAKAPPVAPTAATRIQALA